MRLSPSLWSCHVEGAEIESGGAKAESFWSVGSFGVFSDYRPAYGSDLLGNRKPTRGNHRASGRPDRCLSLALCCYSLVCGLRRPACRLSCCKMGRTLRNLSSDAIRDLR